MNPKIDRTIRDYEAKIEKETHPVMKKLYVMNLALLEMLKSHHGPLRGLRIQNRTR